MPRLNMQTRCICPVCKKTWKGPEGFYVCKGCKDLRQFHGAKEQEDKEGKEKEKGNEKENGV